METGRNFIFQTSWYNSILPNSFLEFRNPQGTLIQALSGFCCFSKKIQAKLTLDFYTDILPGILTLKKCCCWMQPVNLNKVDLWLVGRRHGCTNEVFPYLFCFCNLQPTKSLEISRQIKPWFLFSPHQQLY